MAWPKGRPRRAGHTDETVEDTERSPLMGAEVTDPTIGGVNVNDPRIRSAVQNMSKQGYSKDAMVKLIGAPSEVIDKHLRSLEK